MKYIITEDQYNVIKENEGMISSIQSLIDYYFEDILDKCDGEEFSNENLDLCEIVYHMYEIKVENLEFNTDGKSIIYLVFTYILHSEPEGLYDFYTYYIQPKLEKFFGTKFILRYKTKPYINPY